MRTHPRIAQELASADEDELEDLAVDPRPTTRADCLPGGKNEARPCPYVSCRAHNAVTIGKGGALYVVDDWDDGRPSCSLDVAGDEQDYTLEMVGEILGCTRERVRQIEQEALNEILSRFCTACGSSTRMSVTFVRDVSRTSLQSVEATCPECGWTQRSAK